jgi:putative toxin-antitoxin system antitoxin component (TIGR02293 family)
MRGGPVKETPLSRRRIRVVAKAPADYRYVSLLGIRQRNPLTITRLVSRGLAITALEEFQERTRLSTAELAEVVAIKARTLNRRKKEGRLEPEESDRLVRFSRVFGRALELFEGDADAARRWLSTRLEALGGERPIVMARTDVGSREVEALIDRLEHGVVA